MSKKSKGINAERELLHRFWASGFIAMRAPASGAIRYPCPDLIVGNQLRKLVIECKTTSAKKQYISNEQINNLKQFSQIFAAEAWVAVKFSKDGWFFLNLEDLKQTEGNNYVISVEAARNKGLLFEELISQTSQ